MHTNVITTVKIYYCKKCHGRMFREDNEIICICCGHSEILKEVK